MKPTTVLDTAASFTGLTGEQLATGMLHYAILRATADGTDRKWADLMVEHAVLLRDSLLYEPPAAPAEPVAGEPAADSAGAPEPISASENGSWLAAAREKLRAFSRLG